MELQLKTHNNQIKLNFCQPSAVKKDSRCGARRLFGRYTQEGSKTMKSLLIILIFLVANISHASGRGEGKISILQTGKGWTSSGVYALVTLDVPIQGQPSCATDQRLAIDPSTELGKSIYTILISAKMANVSIEIVGDGSCNIMGSQFEGINYVRLK